MNMNLRRIKLTFLFVSLAELVNKIIPFLLIRVGQSRLGLENLGHAQFAIYIVELFLPVMTWGFELFGPISLRTVDPRSDEWRERIGRIIGTRIFLGIIVYGVLLFSLFYFEKFFPYRTLALAIGGLMFLSSLSTTFVHIADQSLSVLARLTISAKIICFLLVLFFVQKPGDDWIFAILSYGVNVSIALASFVYVIRKYGAIRPRLDGLLQSLKLSFPFALSYILAMLMERVELWFAESRGGATAVGALSGPLRLYQGLLFLIISLSAILYSEGLAYPEKVGRFLRFTVWTLAAFILPLMVGVFFVGEPLLVAFGGAGFTGQGMNFGFICSGMLGHTLLLVAGVQALSALGKIRWTNWAYFGAFLIGVVGSEILVRGHEPSYALLAPALGKTIAGSVLFFLACRETVGFKTLKLPLKGIALGLITMSVFLCFTPDLFWIQRLLAAALVYGLCFVGLSHAVLLKFARKQSLD